VSITSSWVPTGVRRVRRGQLRPRDKVQDWVASQSTKRNAKYDEPFTKKEMERSRGPADIQSDAADLKSELIKAGGSALVKLLQLVNLGNWRPCPQRGRKVIVNLFKAGDTQPGNYRGSPWYQSAARCLQTCCASAWSPKCTCTRLRRRSEAKILHRQLVRAHAHPPRGWQGQQNCLCVLSGRAQSV
jgi:hypothetical protein